jgi:hemolysin activation/secretion protein
MRLVIGLLCALVLAAGAGAQSPQAGEPGKVHIRQLTVVAPGVDPSIVAGARAALEGKDRALLEINEEIRRHFRAHGYMDAAMEEPPQVSGAGDQAEVTVAVTPGPQYRLKAIRIEGATVFPANQLVALFSVVPGQVCNATAIGAGFQRIAELYRSKGYPNLGLIPKPQRNVAERTIAFTILLDEGKATN